MKHKIHTDGTTITKTNCAWYGSHGSHYGVFQLNEMKMLLHKNNVTKIKRPELTIQIAPFFMILFYFLLPVSMLIDGHFVEKNNNRVAENQFPSMDGIVGKYRGLIAIVS